MEILEYIHEHSKFYREGDLFVKVTGRLILLNICQIIKHLDKYTCEFVSSYIYMGAECFRTVDLYFLPKSISRCCWLKKKTLQIGVTILNTSLLFL